MKLNVLTDFDLRAVEVVENNLQRLPLIRESIGQYMVLSVVMNFEAEGRPEEWVDLLPRTWERKTGDMILHESGTLRKSIGSIVEGEHVLIGPSGPGSVYAATHHFGDTDRGIPARPFLVVQEEDEKFIVEMVRGELFYA